MSEVAATREEGSMMDYAVQLMRIIEAICHGTPLRSDSSHLWHHRMASEYLQLALDSGQPSKALLAEVARLKEELSVEQKLRYEAQSKVDELLAERAAFASAEGG